MLVFTLCVMTCFAQDTLEPVPEIMTTLAERWFQDMDVRETGNNNYRPLLANVVRLAFHSCAGSTGCCGYVNLEEEDNAGLDLSVDYLESQMAEWTAAGFSRADLYAYASQVAVGMALGDDMNTILQTVELDRTDCDAMPEVGTVGFPSAHDSPFEYMNTHFGFTPRQTVAIMGAHNIGRAQAGNSGFEGFWVPNPLTLDNEFFDRISDNPWEQEDSNVGGNTLFFWEQNRQGDDLLALNSDMFLVRNFPMLATGEAQMNNCQNNFNNCPDADTLDDVEDFRDNNALFQTTFRTVYAQMMRSAGNGDEQELTSLCERYNCANVEVVAPEAPVNNNNNNQDSSESDSSENDNNQDSSEEEVVEVSDAGEEETGDASEEESESNDDSSDNGRPGRPGRGPGGNDSSEEEVVEESDGEEEDAGEGEENADEGDEETSDAVEEESESNDDSSDNGRPGRPGRGPGGNDGGRPRPGGRPGRRGRNGGRGRRLLH